MVTLEQGILEALQTLDVKKGAVEAKKQTKGKWLTLKLRTLS